MLNDTSRPLKLVVIGGGGGVSQVLLGAQATFAERTGVIAVTDTGRSTGTARALAAMPAPGDLRNTLAALARDPDAPLARLLQHRFSATTLPALDGMAFGNLLIAALTQMTGDFGTAIATVSEWLDCTAHILPVATVNAQLGAEREDGSVASDELAVRALNMAPLRRLTLSPPDAPAHPAVLAAIAAADVVTLGPGSFFTSVMAALLFSGLVTALRQTPATVVFIVNTTTQPGQTDGFTSFEHVRRLVAFLGPGTLDVALLSQSDRLLPHVVAQYAADGLHLLHPNADELAAIAALGVTPLVRDLTEVTASKRTLWNKQDTIRHDPVRLGLALREIALRRCDG